MIAEEVGKILPEAVAYAKNGVDAETLSYAKVTTVLVEAVKEQQQEISALKTTIAKMEAKQR